MLAAALAGAGEQSTAQIVVRTRFWDRALLAAAAADAHQVVILAAGMDARAYRLGWPDGTTVYECTSAEEVVDLLQGGQGVFGIAVSGAMRELTGVISDFPGERADGGESIAAPEDELASRRKFRDRKTG